MEFFVGSVLVCCVKRYLLEREKFVTECDDTDLLESSIETITNRIKEMKINSLEKELEDYTNAVRACMNRKCAFCSKVTEKIINIKEELHFLKRNDITIEVIIEESD